MLSGNWVVHRYSNTNPTTHSPTLSTGTPPQHLNSACIYSELVITGTELTGRTDKEIVFIKAADSASGAGECTSMEKFEMRLSWDFADTCALHVRKFLPFPPVSCFAERSPMTGPQAGGHRR